MNPFTISCTILILLLSIIYMCWTAKEMKTIVHLSFDDVPTIPLGFRKLLLNEISKIRSPHSKQLLNDHDKLCIQRQSRPDSRLQPKQLFSNSEKPNIDRNPKLDNYTMPPLCRSILTEY